MKIQPNSPKHLVKQGTRFLKEYYSPHSGTYYKVENVITIIFPKRRRVRYGWGTGQAEVTIEEAEQYFKSGYWEVVR